MSRLNQFPRLVNKILTSQRVSPKRTPNLPPNSKREEPSGISKGFTLQSCSEWNVENRESTVYPLTKQLQRKRPGSSLAPGSWGCRCRTLGAVAADRDGPLESEASVTSAVSQAIIRKSGHLSRLLAPWERPSLVSWYSKRGINCGLGVMHHDDIDEKY